MMIKNSKIKQNGVLILYLKINNMIKVCKKKIIYKMYK